MGSENSIITTLKDLFSTIGKSLCDFHTNYFDRGFVELVH